MSLINWLKGKLSNNIGPVKKTEPSVHVPTDIENQIDAVISANLPRFSNLMNFNNNVSYWKAVIKAICSAESDFNVLETYYESDLADSKGNDPLTNMRYLSEGLMQLSYSDALVYHCDFDIAGDRNKTEHDPTKTIFNVEKNIVCGLTILDKLVGRHGDFIFNSGNYWSTLEPKNKRHQDFINAFNKYFTKN